MLSNHNSHSAGKLFVRYLVGGLFSLVLMIAISRGVINDQGTQRLFLAGTVLVVNLLTILLFTAAILRSKHLQADADAPDMAYYLGFAMTVGALSFSFLSDVVASQSSGSGASGALARSRLVENALGLFGAGLLATLFGLCAKIYLGSQQAQQFSDPDALYQQFRAEISSLRQTLSATATELATGVQLSCNVMKSAAEGASVAMTELAAELARVHRQISSELAEERITESVRAFAEDLDKLGKPAATFTTAIGAVTHELAKAQADLSELNVQARLATAGLATHLQLGGTLDASTTKLIESNGLLLEQQEALKLAMKGAGSGVKSFSIELSKFHITLPQIADAISKLGDEAKPVSEQFSYLARATAPAVVQIGQFNDALIDAKDSMASLKDANLVMATVTAKGEADARSLQESLTVLNSAVIVTESSLLQLSNKFEDGIGRSHELEQQMQQLSQILRVVNAGAADLLGQLNQSSASIAGLGGSADNAAAALLTAPAAIERLQGPLGLAADSTERLNEALSRLSNRVNDANPAR